MNSAAALNTKSMSQAPAVEFDLDALKVRVDEIAKSWDGEFDLRGSYRSRIEIVRQSKRELGNSGNPTKEELDCCFPDCEHPEARQQPPTSKKQSRHTRPHASRLKNI